VLEATGSSSGLRFEALPVDDPTRRCPDIAKARALLGWEPQIELKEGLRRSLDFFKSKAAIRA
jgi:nucleoside-diphosphate-sugar epimerase